MKARHTTPVTPAASRDWRGRAACRDSEPDLFFPDEAGHLATRQVEAAKRICAGCEVRVVCLDEAVADREPYGVWGGLDEFERQALLAGIAVADLPKAAGQ